MQPLIPERPPTSAELKKWQDLIERFDRTQRKFILATLLEQNVQTITSWGTQAGYGMPMLPADSKTVLNSIYKELAKIQRAIQAAERLEVGVRFANGDIDIVAPAWYTKEQIQDLNLGWVIPVIIGVALIIGLAARVITLEWQLDETVQKKNAQLDAANKIICSDPKDPRCAAWEVEKEKSGFQKTESTIQQIKNGLKTFGKVATTGAGIGLAVGIPLLLWSFFKKAK